MRARDLTRRVRDKVPAVARALRALYIAWAQLTARWRMTPDFIIVGAQRSGTTTLFRVLNEHPNVVRPTFSKGIAYFDLNYHRGMRWYRAHFPLRFVARLKTRGPAYTFESVGYYMFHPLAAERIARDLPGVKLVVMVREPVERAYSAHRHELVRGFETEEFEAAVALEEDRTAGEAERIVADPSYSSHALRHQAYLARSRYAEQIQRLVDLVGEDRVHVVDADRFFNEPAEEYALLNEWLGLPAWVPENVEKWNARARDPLSPELRERLTEYFRPHDEELARLMGRTPWWRR
jgi:hypothetical protein